MDSGSHPDLTAAGTGCRSRAKAAPENPDHPWCKDCGGWRGHHHQVHPVGCRSPYCRQLAHGEAQNGTCVLCARPAALSPAVAGPYGLQHADCVAAAAAEARLAQ